MSAPANVQRLAIAGAGGRMGQMLIDAVAASPDCVLAGALDVPASPVAMTASQRGIRPA